MYSTVNKKKIDWSQDERNTSKQDHVTKSMDEDPEIYQTIKELDTDEEDCDVLLENDALNNSLKIYTEINEDTGKKKFDQEDSATVYMTPSNLQVLKTPSTQ